MSYSTILVNIDGGIATVTLNRPEAMNAWTGQMAIDLTDALTVLDLDDTVRAIVITGTGRAFCAGSDLSGSTNAFAKNVTEEKDVMKALGFCHVMPWQINKPVLAAINGHAVGVGVTYAMSCDIRIVAEEAKLQFAFVRRGIIPELASHIIVPRVVGLSKAADVMLTGRIMKGREFAELGLASKVLPAAEVLPATIELAREFLKAAPVSVAISKRLLWEGFTSGAPDMYKREIPIFANICQQPDATEGVSSFLEKRDPEWKMSVSRDMPDLMNKSRQ